MVGSRPPNEEYDISKMFAKTLKSKREQKKMSQQELAEKSGVSERNIKRYESGEEQIPRFDTAIFLAKTMEASIDDFVPASLRVNRGSYDNVREVHETLKKAQKEQKNALEMIENALEVIEDSGESIDNGD